MTCRMSRRRRKEAFLMAASEMFEGLEKWYDERPEATFGEVEQEAPRQPPAPPHLFPPPLP